MQKNLAIFWHCFLLFKRPVQGGMFCKSQCFLPCKKRLCHFTVALGYVVSHSSGGILWTGFVAHSKRWSKQLQGCFLFSSGKPINCPEVTIFKLWDISTSDFEISSNASRCGFINENSLRAPAYWAEPPNSSYLPLRYCPFCKGHPYEIAETI